MSSKFNAILLATLSLLSVSSFAGDGDQVLRTEATGTKRVMKVGNCTWKHNLDINGNLKLGFELPVTYCVEYRTYKAIQRGWGWTATYEPISEPTISNKIDIATESFDNYFSSGDVVDEALIQMSLSSRCLSMQNQLEDLEDPSACK